MKTKRRDFVPLRLQLADSRAELSAARRRIATLEAKVEALLRPAPKHEPEVTLQRKPQRKPDADLLWGYEAIGAFVGLSADAAKHRALKKQLPVFKQGRTPCATKSGLRAHLARRMVEAEGGQ